MAEHTNNFSLPYPQGRDRVAVHSDIEALAVSADTALNGVQATMQDTAQQLSQAITTEGQRVENAANQYTDTELEEAMKPRLERVATGMYEITAPYLENVTSGVYEIGA